MCIRDSLEERVADEEQPGTERIGGVRESGVGLEGLLGEAQVRAVQERQHVHEQQQREQMSIRRCERR